VELDASQALVTLLRVPDRPGQAASVFKAVAGAGVNVDMIVQDISRQGHTHLSFSIPATSVPATLDALAPLVGRENVVVESPVAKLSVMGVGIRSHTGVATRMFAALAAAHINISMINTSEVRINVATDAAHGVQGLRALRKAFDIEEPRAEVTSSIA